MVREERNLTNIKLTESDEDGIWLHFAGGGLSGGINISLSVLMRGDITNRAMHRWAREQLDKQDIAHRRFYLQPIELGTRPSPPREGGY